MTPKAAKPSRCPGCGAEFECGMLAGRERCWCEDLPTLREPEAGSLCYCPRCLELKVRSEPGPRSERVP
ncbi:MAG TPA: cysteine-rich CWC family protein [Burkholderiales bacterium]|nr:cysteine-rich CWC family protein [Burkholderiales bacterium]